MVGVFQPRTAAVYRVTKGTVHFRSRISLSVRGFYDFLRNFSPKFLLPSVDTLRGDVPLRIAGLRAPFRGENYRKRNGVPFPARFRDRKTSSPTREEKKRQDEDERGEKVEKVVSRNATRFPENKGYRYRTVPMLREDRCRAPMCTRISL